MSTKLRVIPKEFCHEAKFLSMSLKAEWSQLRHQIKMHTSPLQESIST